MSAPPSSLDFGIMCNADSLQRWQLECVNRLQQTDGINIQLLIQPTDTDGGWKKRVKDLSAYKDRTNISEAVNKVSWWAYRNVLSGKPESEELVRLPPSIHEIDSIKCRTEHEGFTEYFHESDLEKIADYDLDVILRFAFGIIRGDILETPTYGVWSFHHGDEQKYRGGVPGFWEGYFGDPLTGSILQRLTNELDGGVLLKKGYFSTSKYSYNETLDRIYYGTVEWPAQVAKDLLNGHGEYVNGDSLHTDAPIYRSPSPGQLFLYNAQVARRMIGDSISGVTKWNIGVVNTSETALESEGFPKEITWYSHLHGNQFLADPFPITINGQQYIFVEEYAYDSGKGHISVIEYPDGFKNGTLRTVLKKPHHLSYPYIFRRNGQVYATPEAHASNEITLYRVESPTDWQKEQTLIEGVRAIDPTVICYEDRWWLFFTKQGDYPNTKLHVWYASELTETWKPHKNNPVKTDTTSARPGGKPYKSENRLYRPTQNCAEKYGHKITLNEVKEITPEVFEEEEVATVSTSQSSEYPARMHTLSHGSDITLVDGAKDVYEIGVLKERVRDMRSRL